MRRRITRVADLLNPAAVLLPAANVIMQLSLPGVGYGVLESPVDSGNVYKHPFKRARTTGTYLAVATIGTRVGPRAASGQPSTPLIGRYGRRRRARCPTTRSTRACSCGWPPACIATSSISTSSCMARSTMRPRMRSIRTASDWAPHFKFATRCGHRTAWRSTTTGSGQWKTCASIPRSANTCTGWRQWRFCRRRCRRWPDRSTFSRRRAFWLRSSAR